jgi:hypothetical protein
MQTNNSKPTPRVNEDAERFDEITGGYDMVDHDRAAKRINADLRKMDAGHTPGPWRIKGGMIVGDSGVNVAAASVAPSYNDMCANARLIASAPDLLAACKTAKHELTQAMSHYPADDRASINAAKAAVTLLDLAIARATNGGGM